MGYIVGLVVLVVVSILAIVYGAFLFSGSRTCFRILCGGEGFLALDPDDAEFEKSARSSAVAVWMIVAIVWCAMASASACLSEELRTAARVVGAMAGAVIAAAVVFQIKQHANLLKERGSRPPERSER
ncbi:hypothetical protein B5F40_05615 [Gordonibacter sp. An230]|uniref:hypothetical protein n=1 Tax=Gordonibacter sp. An230 TaxID=1965592 RepID=UPI000B364C77|nr:hypothetical protein [Gordonibacter sp. An230]OUO90669.1 hypothetical protein B5F40_05615 [Gordonibacter sp. An230]